MAKKVFFLSNLLIGICLIVLLSFWGFSKINAYEDNGSFRLLVFGDSLSSGYRLPEDAGFIPQLQNALQDEGYDNVELINAAVSGDTTADGVRRLDAALALNPHAVIVELGANDVLQGINMDETEKNLNTIISTFIENSVPVMLIGVRMPMVTDIKGRERLNTIYNSLTKKYKLVFYPHFLDGVLIERFGSYDLKYMQEDGAHPNASGVQIMVKKVFPSVKKFLTSL